MKYDLVIVGAGPAGLSTAIKLKQLDKKNNTNHSVCVIEKGAEVGAHILSGAISVIINPFSYKQLNIFVSCFSIINASLFDK